MFRTVLAIVTSTFCAALSLCGQEKESSSAEIKRLIPLAAETQIFFPKSSAYLRVAETKKIARLAKALGEVPDAILIIAGRTDKWGNQEFNSWLREERSAAVARQFESHGIDKVRLVIAKQPSDKPEPGESAAELRRVDFSLKGHEEAIAKSRATRPEITEPTAATKPKSPPTTAPKFRKLRRSDSHLRFLEQTCASTHVYFEHMSSSVRSDYWRDLKQLAEAVLTTRNGAIAITGFASPNLAEDKRKRLGDRRSMGAAARLHAVGVGWDRILILPATGDSNHPAPHWRNHRVEFAARVMLNPPKIELVRTRPSERSSTPTRIGSSTGSDSLSALTAQAPIYFGPGSSALKAVDRRALKEIARMLSSKNETRSLVIQSFFDSRHHGTEWNEISERRQNVILDYLIQNDAPHERLLLRKQAVSDEESEDPSWKQRRVELVVQEGSTVGQVDREPTTKQDL